MHDINHHLYALCIAQGMICNYVWVNELAELMNG